MKQNQQQQQQQQSSRNTSNIKTPTTQNKLNQNKPLNSPQNLNKLGQSGITVQNTSNDISLTHNNSSTQRNLVGAGANQFNKLLQPIIEQQDEFLLGQPFANVSFLMAEFILSKIYRRIDYKIFEKDLDQMRSDYCTNLALSDASETVYMCYDIQYDIGEYEPLPEEWISEEDEMEPCPAIRDVYATMCVPDERERIEPLPNLYEDGRNPEVRQEQRHIQMEQRRAFWKEIELKRKGHLVIKHGSANVVGSIGEPWASDGVIQLRDPRAVEADDELAIKIRDEKEQQRLKQVRQAKEEKDRLLKDKQRAVEIEGLNKELDRGTYTYDFQGHIMLQNNQAAEQIPPDFKFKYRFKKGRGSNGPNKKYKSSKVQVNFTDSKQTGFLPADANKLSKLVDNNTKSLQNIRQTAGSMFDFIKPGEAGIIIKEDKKFKVSKKEYDELVGKMSLDNYQKKINTDGNFLSSMIHPELKLSENDKELMGTYQRAPLMQTLAQSLKNSLASKVQEFKDQEEFINRMRNEFDRQNPKSSSGMRGSPNKNFNFQAMNAADPLIDNHLVLLKSPESLNQLIIFPDYNNKNRHYLTQSVLSSNNKDNKSSTFFNQNSSVVSLKSKINPQQQQNSKGIQKNYSSTQNKQFSQAMGQNFGQNSSIKQQQFLKTTEVTNDLFKLKREKQSQSDLESVQEKDRAAQGMFMELNEQIITQSAGWGHGNDNFPSLMQKNQSHKNLRQQQNSMSPSKAQTPSLFNKHKNQNNIRLGTAQQDQKRPFSRTTLLSSGSQQSLRGALTTANSNHRTQRRNIFTFKLNNGQSLQSGESLVNGEMLNHLPPPPLGKTTGHGLISQTYSSGSLLTQGQDKKFLASGNQSTEGRSTLVSQRHQHQVSSQQQQQQSTQQQSKQNSIPQSSNIKQRQQNANHLFNQIGFKSSQRGPDKQQKGGKSNMEQKFQISTNYDNINDVAGRGGIYEDVRIEKFE